MTDWQEHLIIGPIVLPMVIAAAMLLFDERRRLLKGGLSLFAMAAIASQPSNSGGGSPAAGSGQMPKPASCSRFHGNSGPGSILRPGARSSWPMTCWRGMPWRRVTSSSSTISFSICTSG